MKSEKLAYIYIYIYIYCVNIPIIALIKGISMSILKFYLFLPILDPFLAFGYIWGQIPIDFHMRIYKLCKNA